MTYTYVDAGDFNNSNLGAEQSPFTGGLPLAGVSKHTINAVGFYEKGPLSARLAYNWRSDFLQTPRDVIFPFKQPPDAWPAITSEPQNFPMHCHAEMSQTAGGGMYPHGMHCLLALGKKPTIESDLTQGVAKLP